jgi:hypothetical protein
METLALILIVIGGIISVVYGIILLIKAFQTSIWWGLGYIFIPLVALIFVVVHWDVAKKPFLMGLLCIPFFLVGFMLSPEMVGAISQ